MEPLRRGIELGAFLIDTAEIYGTEEAVAEAIRGIRDRVFIATKVWAEHLRYDDVLRAAEASLRLLDTDYIDLYQIHWPNSRIPIKETMRAMEALVETMELLSSPGFNTALKQMESGRMKFYDVAALDAAMSK